MILKKVYSLVTLAVGLVSVAHAWDAESQAACDALAARAEQGFEDMLRYQERHYSQFNYKGWELWQIEVPKLLRQVAATGQVNMVSSAGFSALQAACYYADVKLAAALLQDGADVNTRPMGWNGYGFPGDTPIALLVRGMSPETAEARVQIAKMLMEKGANPDTDMMDWVWGGSAPVTPFCYLSDAPYNNAMRMVLLQGAPQSLKTRSKTWNLNWAAYSPEVIRTLLEAGVSPNRNVSEKGATLLLHLVQQGDIELMKLALEKGADVQASLLMKNNFGGYLFEIPAGEDVDPEKALTIAKLLLAAKADLKAKRNGQSLYAYYSHIQTPAALALARFFSSKGIVR